jgi:hypothetical protein
VSSGVDAFSQAIDKHDNYYAFPPYCLLASVFRFIIDEQINCTLIFPHFIPVPNKILIMESPTNRTGLNSCFFLSLKYLLKGTVTLKPTEKLKRAANISNYKPNLSLIFTPSPSHLSAGVGPFSQAIDKHENY